MIGSDPWFSGVRAVQGGVTVGIVLDDALQQSMPAGTSQIVIKITVRVPQGTAPATFGIQFSGTLGTPDVPLEMVMPIGSVVPVTQPASLRVIQGTCMIAPIDGYFPAAVGQVLEEEVPGAEPAAEPAPAPATTDENENEPPPDPSELDFPEPTEEELEVTWKYQAEQDSTGLPSEALAADHSDEVATGSSAEIPQTPASDDAAAESAEQQSDTPPCTPDCPGSDIPCFLRGDVNGNGAVEFDSADSDEVHLRNYLYKGGTAPPCMDAADVNDDGAVSHFDLMMLLAWHLGRRREPACPGPTTCGVDPTPDDGIECAGPAPCP
ncbi:MAG: dockerin type I domain-containing protein [Planctomycetes bacterium]|nr:dockerin type I domain-containing protein [Planctomycetota bacterium]